MAGRPGPPRWPGPRCGHRPRSRSTGASPPAAQRPAPDQRAHADQEDTEAERGEQDRRRHGQGLGQPDREEVHRVSDVPPERIVIRTARQRRSGPTSPGRSTARAPPGRGPPGRGQRPAALPGSRRRRSRAGTGLRPAAAQLRQQLGTPALDPPVRHPTVPPAAGRTDRETRRYRRPAQLGDVQAGADQEQCGDLRARGGEQPDHGPDLKLRRFRGQALTEQGSRASVGTGRLGLGLDRRSSVVPTVGAAASGSGGGHRHLRTVSVVYQRIQTSVTCADR
jgi:hypothetical protein